MSTAPRRRKRSYEAPAIGAAAARMVAALVRRAADGDTEALEELVKLEALLPTAVSQAGAGLHRFGFSWGDLARFTGLTRQAWSQRCKGRAA